MEDVPSLPLEADALLWLETRVLSSLKLKPDRWKKMTSQDESRRALYEFFEVADVRRLFVFLTKKGALVAADHPPTELHKKGMFFLKIRRVPVSAQSLDREVVCGDLPPKPLELLSTAAQEVYLPLLGNPGNQHGWSDDMAKEVLESLHRFSSNVYVTIGLMRGQTLLPLPPADSGADRMYKDKDKMHVLESAVVTWTRQIKNVMKMDPEAPLKVLGLNPGPDVEVEFWVAKAANLNSIHEQLNGEKIKKVVRVLEVTKSTYAPAFSRLCREVGQARLEANDNAKFLRPLEPWFQRLHNESTFNNVVVVFRPMMHLIVLIWKHSKHYNTPVRLVVLMREVCNEIIEHARRHVDAENIFRVDPTVAVQKVKQTLKVCGMFKSCYFDSKAKASQESPQNPWRFQNSALFHRLDAFLERLHDILDLSQTVVRFENLERIEIGGTRGKSLGTSVRQISTDFQQAVQRFKTVQYDVLDIEQKRFDDDFYDFRTTVKELERRLANVVSQGFDDCITVESAFKLMDTFEGLLHRDLIQADLERKELDLLDQYRRDLTVVHEEFLAAKDTPPVPVNMPPIAGSIMWVRGLLQRVQGPMNKFDELGGLFSDSDQAKEVTKMYQGLLSAATEYESVQRSNWEKDLQDTSQHKLKEPVLRRNADDRMLHVNFDPALVALLREVKYLLLLKVSIPDAAMDIYKKVEAFRSQTGNLQIIVQKYNHMLVSTIDVERPLLQQQFDQIDTSLEKGVKHLNWKSYGINEFITNSMTSVKDAAHILSTIQNNVGKIQSVMDGWLVNLLFERKNKKTSNRDDFQEKHLALQQTRLAEIGDSGHEFHKLLMNSHSVLKVSKGAPAWKAYVDYVSGIVQSGISTLVVKSLQYLLEQVDPESIARLEISPLLEIKLELIVPDIIFSPDLSEEGGRDGIRDTVNEWIRGFLNSGKLVKKLDGSSDDYMNDLEENKEIHRLVYLINENLKKNEAECTKFRNSYEKFAYLWKCDINSTFQKFLQGVANAHEGAPEPQPQTVNSTESFKNTRPPSRGKDSSVEPSLAEFDEQISRYRSIQDEVQQLPNSSVIGWLRVDSKPIKQALSTWVTKWVFCFTQHLTAKVKDSLHELGDFMDKVNKGLDDEVQPGDLPRLVKAMGFIRDVRINEENIDAMFEPLRQTVALLKKYGFALDASTVQFLDEAPLKWNNLKKKTFQSREKLNTLQTQQADIIKGDVASFSHIVTEFRADFVRSAPFNSDWEPRDAFTGLDVFETKIDGVETQAAEYNEKQELFELSVTEYKDIAECREECRLLRAVWMKREDIMDQMGKWRRTQWDQVDVDDLLTTAGKMLVTLRALGRRVREWSVYKNLEDSVKNMKTSLPLVMELRSEAMRDRHWKELGHITAKQFRMDERFTLGDLLDLGLHKHVDDVAAIVDKATKELAIEKALTKIDETWVSMTLEFKTYEEDESATVLRNTGDIFEVLEDNQVSLQNMQASKRYVANFIDSVNKWQSKLSVVEVVLQLWLDVQRRWASLQGIFAKEDADIRVQLVEDSKRFDAVNKEFRQLMTEAGQTPNVIEATSRKATHPALDSMLERLEHCQKSLAEYLEVKRKLFPRFYFVSAADQVDILSKGNNPHLIMRHLPKLFDAINELDFTYEGREMTKNAIGLHSREQEYVKFQRDLRCEGPVEKWLDDLASVFRHSLAVYLSEAVGSYLEKAYETWLFDYCAQVTIVASQIWNTHNVNHHFDKLEEGQKNALIEYNAKQQERLDHLIQFVQGDLEDDKRQKIMTLVTFEVHARDIVKQLIDEKAENSSQFTWQAQLRYAWNDETRECAISIADAHFDYGYEYLGNASRLVITPLTDRCYITLTQALHLIMGGAPAGPAGTGKTETTKDLARALGAPCYVFNCSEQMDYRSMANVFKGLSQSGAWGCFDEFNRISVEVLSVVSAQFKSILQAIRAKKEKFDFQGEEISLNPSCGVFITMNPGYSGRTELPENIKALFRPVSMIVPDLEQISEIMLMSQGFQDAKPLAKKVVTLYRLNSELLSKQVEFYDWGLRAVKSVLVVAGTLRRAEPNTSEDIVLMRALRDFNAPKIILEDMDVFLGLITDLFPNAEGGVRKRNQKFESIVEEVARERGLQAGNGSKSEEMFVLKVVQLFELLSIRHSVFIIGPPGSGKSEVWKVLAKSQERALGGRTVVPILNPKAVSTNELYGCINRTTRDWNDGLFSVIMRNLSNMTSHDPKWILLDGDVDPNWIESLNTVMDDNKVLTLANNERIALNPSMRLVFELGHLKHATPATVSRAGILFINEDDIGWSPFVSSWVQSSQNAADVMAVVKDLFEKYVPETIEYLRKSCKQVIPISAFNMVQTLCSLLEGLVTPETCPTNSDKVLIEYYFNFACMWAFGGALSADKTSDYVDEFSRWWTREMCRLVSFPDAGQVFDYCVDPTGGPGGKPCMVSWETKVPPSSESISALVPTPETTRLLHIMELLAQNAHPVLIVGLAGTGKTSLVKDLLSTSARNSDEFLHTTINLNYHTDSTLLQSRLEAPLEKKAGKQWGPPGTKKLTYFIDDLNMPMVDAYGTQSPLALLRQHLDYGFWYDRQKMQPREVGNVQYLACMNHTAGSFTINERLQRHFSTFACSFPKPVALQMIYGTILNSHMASFDPTVQSLSAKVLDATIELHRDVSDTFTPTAAKFHYQFNLRDLSNIFAGLCLSDSRHIRSPLNICRLWVHECTRAFRDRLTTEADVTHFNDLIVEMSKKYFEELRQEEVHQQPLTFASFLEEPELDETAHIGGDETIRRLYTPAHDFESLKKIVEEKLLEYNDFNAAMDLVLFEDAIDHVCRISRILDLPHGHALLVGVGGSGKQSLARLAAFVSGYDVNQITVHPKYAVADFRNDLADMYLQAGTKDKHIVFLLTDVQIVDERFLVYINDALSTGHIPDLFPAEQKDAIYDSVRAEVKRAGLMDTNELCWDYFIEKVRRNLRVIVCHSPAGDRFRVRCRQFPALITCTVTDWFHPWPREALVSVATRFLVDLELGGEDMRENVAHHIAFVHRSVQEESLLYLEQDRRYNYATPKSFLELIQLYKSLLTKKTADMTTLSKRLTTGLDRLQSTAEDAIELQSQLAQEQIVVEEKKTTTEQLLAQVGQDRAVAEDQNKLAEEEEARMAVMQEEISQMQTKAQAEMDKAQPLLDSALDALKVLDRTQLNEMRSYSRPPEEVSTVMAAVMIITSPPSGVARNVQWAKARQTMTNLDAFIHSLEDFDRENIPPANIAAVEKYVKNEKFNVAEIRKKSVAAGGICQWVRAMYDFHFVIQDVKPLRANLAEANSRLEAATAKLNMIREKKRQLDERVRQLTENYEVAAAEKARVVAQAEKTRDQLGLSNRLTSALASNKSQWSDDIERLHEKEKTLAGDVLLAAAFISYIGNFNRKFRDHLLSERWLKDLQERDVPTSEEIDVLEMIAGDANIAQWNNEGLPADRLSSENGAIVNQCARWPLMIDPQLQGLSWIKQREASNGLKVVQMDDPNLLKVVERAVTCGDPLLIEGVDEVIDESLSNVVARRTTRKGRSIQLGGREIEYDKSFKLFLHTTVSNPHFRPEISAETTLINFTVTQRGLEDQLLAKVVSMERADLEQERTETIKKQNENKIRLKELEDEVLVRLSETTDILEETVLIEQLQNTKLSIELAQATALKAQQGINEAREVYRRVAARAATMYFVMDQLSSVDHMYQFSLDAFMSVFVKALTFAEASEDVETRIKHLLEAVTLAEYNYASSGLFERHKMILSSQIAFKVLLLEGSPEERKLNEELLRFLIRGPKAPDAELPADCADWMPLAAWQRLSALSSVAVFQNLPSDLEATWKRWRDWFNSEQAENERLPLEWKNLPNFQKLLVIRCLRPDRLTQAVRGFVGDFLGQQFVSAQPDDLEALVTGLGPSTPIFYILSPGVDPVKNVERVAKTLKAFTRDNGRFVSVAMGQGQEVIAERSLDAAYREGGWVVLENVHLTTKWLPALVKKINHLTAPDAGAHEDFRIFLSAEPSHGIPVPLLQKSVKLTNEPPHGLKANLQRAVGAFTTEWEEWSGLEFKTILLALCVFHGVILERRNFGPQGWNRVYPFNMGDLTVSAAVVANYLENSARVPWEDLRYVIGEIMYGGHITDDWDRRLCRTYLDNYLRPEILQEGELFPGFKAPSQGMSKPKLIAWLDESLPPESSTAFGLHPNAEIDFRTQEGAELLHTLLDLQPRGSSGADGGSVQETWASIQEHVDEILEKLPDGLNVGDVMERLDASERDPFNNVFLQECRSMNTLLIVMRASLKELDMGLRGDLTISADMERLMDALHTDRVPTAWEKLAYPSMRPLGSWLIDLLARITQLQNWTEDLSMPPTVWLSGLFNPQSFLTAIMQVTARKNDWPLDKMALHTEVTKKTADEVQSPPREGAYVHGLFIEGARWNTETGSLDDARLKELHPGMPVIHIQAIPVSKVDSSLYACPVYKTQRRGPGYVFTAGLRSSHMAPSAKWVLSGVALLMDVVD